MTTQELEQQVKTLVAENKALKARLDALNNNATIPFDTGEAFKARVLSDVGVALTSTKSATSENKSVNEGGASTYDVMNKPDGFLEISILGNIYYVPYFS